MWLKTVYYVCKQFVDKLNGLFQECTRKYSKSLRPEVN